MAKRTERRRLKTVLCTCGGTLRPARMNKLDLSGHLGIDVTLAGKVPGMKCDTCGEYVLASAFLEKAVDAAALHVVSLQRRLSGREAQFLRRAVLGIGQVELADQMGISRSTIARWEQAQSLGPEQDFELRAMLLGRLLKSARLDSSQPKGRYRELTTMAEELLQRAREEPAPKRIPALEIRGSA